MSKCDFICPPGLPKYHCCAWCSQARKGYVNDANKHLWDERKGFLGDNGCRLTREEMPMECREYDCKKMPWMFFHIKYTPIVWGGEKWKALRPIEGKFAGVLGHVEELLKALRDNIEKHNSIIESEIREIINND